MTARGKGQHGRMLEQEGCKVDGMMVSYESVGDCSCFVLALGSRFAEELDSVDLDT